MVQERKKTSLFLDPMGVLLNSCEGVAYTPRELGICPHSRAKEFGAQWCGSGVNETDSIVMLRGKTERL
ncbi:hypothetical protein M378DRAFT_241866 [Amanita muscaria Koide BX008]|uniref:Uncharacterized protein n=1 Tax=Amanita muscaria (strain Koide BX008) TaxID=946122 RepID=A0A0C2XQ32_AMAMK|nr:hypothetical protein M378DRAFT_241866 [Amanita muscaria Koide BX008]